MHHGIHALKSLRNSLGVCDVTNQQLHRAITEVRLEVCGMTSIGQQIQNPNGPIGAGAAQQMNKIAADKPSATGDQQTHKTSHDESF
jgi:hypothetical protein